MSRGSVASNVSRATSTVSRATSTVSRANSQYGRALPRVSVRHPVLDQARLMKGILQSLLAKRDPVLQPDAAGFVRSLQFGAFVGEMQRLEDEHRNPESELGKYVRDPDFLPPILTFFSGTDFPLTYYPDMWAGSFDAAKHLRTVVSVYEGAHYIGLYTKKDILSAFLFVYTEVEKWLSNLLTEGKRREIRRNQYLQRLEGMAKSTGMDMGDSESFTDYVARVAKAALEGKDNILNTKSIRQLVEPVMFTLIKEEITGVKPEDAAWIIANRVHPNARKYFIKATRSMTINRRKSKGYLARQRRRDEDGNSVATEEDPDLVEETPSRGGTGREGSGGPGGGMGSKAAGVSFDTSPQFVSMRFQ